MSCSLCMSSYLAFRYVVDPSWEWISGMRPDNYEGKQADQIAVNDEQDIAGFISDYISKHFDNKTGILLSGGIDSAILASYLPPETKAYTIVFVAEGAKDESITAAEFSKVYGLDHKIVYVTWADYTEYAVPLMLKKKAPLHAVEVGLYKAARMAASDGVSRLLIGNGADSTFGGMDKLLSRDWTFDEFVDRYTFIRPEAVLKEPASIYHIYEPYREGRYINYIAFLKEVHGRGIIEAFDNALTLGGCFSLQPYEHMKLAAPLDLTRVRNGESKYLLRSLFEKRYPGFQVPGKIPFARPMNQWLENWKGPSRHEFRDDINIQSFDGDQKWLLFCLELFLNNISST